MSFEKTINGILKYLNSEIYSRMNEWQEMLARIAVSRMIGNVEGLKSSFVNNSFVKTFSVMDEHGNVDVDGLYRDLKTQIERKGKFSFSLPMFGNFTFTAEDVDKLYRMITEG